MLCVLRLRLRGCQSVVAVSRGTLRTVNRRRDGHGERGARVDEAHVVCKLLQPSWRLSTTRETGRRTYVLQSNPMSFTVTI